MRCRSLVLFCFLLLLFATPAFAKAPPTTGQLQKRIIKLERQVKALLAATNTIVDEQVDLEEEVDGVQNSVAELNKSLAAHIAGSANTGSQWTLKSIRPDSSLGVIEDNCSITFTATSDVQGTFSMSPFFCLVDSREWSSPATVTGKYIVTGESIVFFDFQDSGDIVDVLYGNTPYSADALIQGGKITLIGTGFHQVRVKLTPQ